MNFSESETYLLSLGNEVAAMKLGLENIHTLLVALGKPQNDYLKVQVAGTNGKGSMCAFLDSICNSAGIKTGTFTSPHLVSITERIRINGSDISEDDFARHATLVRETAENLLENGEIEYRPTFFEQITAIALVAFSEANVEVAILETGLGGRLDATTAANAEIAAITRIDLDHQEYLGETIEEIAAEKAAIIHKGSRVVIGEQSNDALQVLLARCANVGVVPVLVEGATHATPVVLPPLGLKGRHQAENARVAILLAEHLKGSFPITQQNMVDGLSNGQHPGRLEFQGNYLFDGAHNVGGARALRAFLDEFVDKPITLVFGAMKDKDVPEVLEILLPKAERIILTRPNNERALTSEQILQFVPDSYHRDSIFLTGSVAEAVAVTESMASDDPITLITGSLYLVGEAKRFLSSQI